MECYGTIEIIGGDTVARSETCLASCAIMDDGLTDMSPILFTCVVGKLELNLILAPEEAIDLGNSLKVLGQGAIDDFDRRGGEAPRYRA